MDIQQAIDERKKLISRIQLEVTALEKAADILRGKSETSRPKTQADMASAVLDEIGKPMHVSQIADQIKNRFKENVPVNNIAVMLFRYSKRGNKFFKVDNRPNTYGLVRWQNIAERLEASQMGTK